MVIRPAVLTDVPDLFQCTVEAFRDYILLIGQTPGPMQEDYWEAVKDHPVFVAEAEGLLLGFVLIKDGEGDFMWLDVLAAVPHRQNRGVGKALVKYTEDYIKACGKAECRLYTHVKYERNIAIYHHLGYEIYDRVQEAGFDRYYMRKALK